MKYAKAIWGALIAFVAPGATVLLTELAGDGIQGSDWLKAGLVCVVSAAAVGGGVAAIRSSYFVAMPNVAAHLDPETGALIAGPAAPGVASRVVGSTNVGDVVDVTKADGPEL